LRCETINCPLDALFEYEACDRTAPPRCSIRRFGGPEELEVVDARLPTAGPGEVRVRVLASGLEYTDTLIRRHLYPQTATRRPPFVMGYDVIGEIDQIGERDGIQH
jgi:NADPH:quinone reductase-like Zn-dependent oxidoreductase